MKIKVSSYVYKKCVQFAEDRMGDSVDLYKYRGESNKIKMLDDIVTGTVGEWGAYQFLKNAGIKVNKPDMKIYEKKRKSFDADLISDDFKFHVKSQNPLSRKRYGSSWLLQRSDKIVKDPQENEYFILTCVDGRDVEILACIKIRDIHDLQLWSECRVPRYRHSKIALYLDDMEDIERRYFYES